MSKNWYFCILLVLATLLVPTLALLNDIPPGSNMDEGQPKSWPELVGIPGTEAREKILAEDPTLQVGIVRPGMMVTMDYRLNRVRIYVDKDGIVNRPPTLG
ncbi:unnamed protein product [Closterium sp. Naga37s-1]|nr:unnamed protein product [Closterium sp. Naga37s-1]